MGFRDFLINECHVPEKKAPYFSKWVSIFKRCDENPEAFLAFMQKSYQDWPGYQRNSEKRKRDNPAAWIIISD
jgi:hypothetical protein